MTGQTIFEILNSKYNIPAEMNKIRNLFYSKMCYIKRPCYAPEYFTIEQVVDEVCLHKWKQRGSYLNCNEIKRSINIPEKFDEKTSFENIAISLEYYLNILHLFIYKRNRNIELIEQFNILPENIGILLKHINYKLVEIKLEEKIIIVPENPESIAVAEKSSEETALAILKYNHYSLKGNLEEKRKLLYQIAREYEPLFKNKIEGYKEFYGVVEALLNNLHIRHNNIDEENNNNTVIDMEDNELEEWYDDLYQLMLFCILIKDNFERKNKVKEFLKNLRNGAN